METPIVDDTQSHILPVDQNDSSIIIPASEAEQSGTGTTVYKVLKNQQEILKNQHEIIKLIKSLATCCKSTTLRTSTLAGETKKPALPKEVEDFKVYTDNVRQTKSMDTILNNKLVAGIFSVEQVPGGSECKYV